jgi:type VI secretion system protein ImpE
MGTKAEPGMTPSQLFEKGKVREAENALNVYLRSNPADAVQRTFLFELLCFSGQYDRAEKQLSILAQGGGDAETGAVLYYSAIQAERTRHEIFRNRGFSGAPDPPAHPGVLNGKPFRCISDLDPAIGASLEIFAGGEYLRIPFVHVASMHIEPPRRLRDTLWAPAYVLPGPGYQGTGIGQTIIPAAYPFSWNSEDESVWLGRMTEWVSDESGREFPLGQKMFVVDGEEVPLLEIRSLEFSVHAAA